MNDRLDLRPLLRFAALASIVVLIVLSTVPGSERPHVLSSGDVEHFVAYAGTAFLLVGGFGQRRLVAIGLSVASALLEVAQIWVPGRSAGVDNWLASSLGALAGTVAATVFVAVVLRSRAAAVSEVGPVDDAA